MRSILKSLVVVALIATVVTGATTAYFSDVEVSQNNTITAGTLDLSVDGANPLATAAFTVTDFVPGDTKSVTYVLKNEGSIDGYIDVRDISVTSAENGCNEPEVAAGDTTCATPGSGEGELADRVTMTLYFDDNCNVVADGGESVIYEGAASGIAGAYDANRMLAHGATQCIGVTLAWTQSAQDNIAQGDDLALALTFELGQTQGQ